jgi:D-alanine transaminase
MTEWIWINGEIVNLAEARIGVEDRGFQFADGVYEVIRLYNGRGFTLNEHLDRLARSAEGIKITLPLDRKALMGEIEKLVDRSGVKEGMIYLQLTRGAAPRNHIYTPGLKPTLLFYARPLPPVNAPGQGAGAKLQTAADERWQRCWIKSIALLPNVLAKNEAVAAGADEAVFVDGGFVTECSASNLFAVIGGKAVTHPVGPKVLPGITRAALLELAKEAGVAVEQRPITLEEARAAEELFITSTTRELSWVSHWDGQAVAERCGTVTRRLHEAYRGKVERETK